MTAARRPVMDDLEPRRLLALTVVSDGGVTAIGPVFSAFDVTHTGTLVVHGTADGDTINISRNKGKLLVTFRLKSGLTVASSATTASVKRILVEGNGGNDLITIDSDVEERATILGGSGNDNLNGNYGATLVGGSGNDDLHAAARRLFDAVTGQETTTTSDLASLLSGGEGDDHILADRDDVIVGGKGEDSAGLTLKLTNAQPGTHGALFSGLDIEGELAGASGVENLGGLGVAFGTVTAS